MKKEKNEEKPRKLKKFGFLRKILDAFQCLPLSLKPSSTISFAISMIFSECVSLSLRKSTTNLVSHLFCQGKVTIFIVRGTKHTFSDENQRKNSLGSAPPTTIILFNIFTIQQQQSNLVRFRFNRRGVHSGELNHQSRPVSLRHHISMEHRLRRKHLL